MSDDLSPFLGYDDGQLNLVPFNEHAGISPARLLEVPDKMYVELATGLEEAKDVALRHGFTEDEINAFLAFKPFADRVQAHVSQLQAEGITTRLKARLYHDAMVEDLIVYGLAASTSVGQKLEIAEHFAKVGDVIPKQAAQQSVGPPAVININFPQMPEKTVTIDNGA